jgi:glutamine amidotransferase
MCRFVAYLGGPPMVLSDLVITPKNSLLMQSRDASESKTRTNGDGFGLGWYAPSLSANPALFTSVFPAWNDRNLLSLATKIESPAFFAHVRAATGGSVSHVNCHPFVHEQWMMMHNGHVSNFKVIKRHLRRMLDDDLYDWIQGSTDSEHLFALFLQQARGRDLSSIQTVADALEETFHVTHDLVKMHGKDASDVSYLNVCLTDGVRMVASRYASDAKASPLSLHYALEPEQQGALVSSERLSKTNRTWKSVPPGQMVLVEKGGAPSFRKIKRT